MVNTWVKNELRDALKNPLFTMYWNQCSPSPEYARRELDFAKFFK